MNEQLAFLELTPKTSFIKTWQGNCFACSPKNEHGLHLTFTHVPGFCYSKFKIPLEFCGFETMAHGGIVATLLDEIAGWTIMTNLLKFAFTMEATIKYIKPVPVNTEIIIVGKINAEKGQNIFMNSSIFLENGLLLAEMVSKWFSPTQEQAMKITGRNTKELERYSNEAFSEIKIALSKNPPKG
jgi:hypothetical protein